MSKQYKHKTLPLTVEKSTDRLYRGFNSLTGIKYRFPPECIENSNDWEEIIETTKVEKDYEILSFKSNQDCRIAHKQKDGKYSFQPYLSCGKGCCTEKQMLEGFHGNNTYLIYSIKRLLDGEIFQIKDIISYDSTGKTTITGFETYGADKDILIANFADKINGVSGSTIKCIDKVKQPLFITEDGKEIFKDDKGPLKWGNYPYVDTTTWNIDTIQRGCDRNSPMATSEKDRYTHCKIFSTKEAAEEYIIMNKPCLSLQDLLNLNLHDLDYSTIELYKSDLKVLVKSKLK